MCCAAQGLLTVKLVHKQDHIATINRGHELIAGAAEAESSEVSTLCSASLPTAMLCSASDCKLLCKPAHCCALLCQ